uniref:Integrase catalytic domain-containing protein n=1 Tax=Fagus sylvatica TaxID=28930 RepID=A0A2N9EIQ9_FAGSY
MADSTATILDNLTSKMTEVLTRVQTSPSPITDSPMVPINIKLDGSNYGLWSQVVEMYISGKDKLGYINGDYPQPPETDPSFRKWRTENAMVKGWLINSMDHSLVVNFIRYPTTKQVWDSTATTYFDGTDTSQVYELRRRVSRMKQAGGSIEKYYNNLQGLWREIDFRRPNPMKCADDIQSYNSILQEERVYTFLDGLDDRLDHVRSDVLHLKPFPSIEQAYAHVRREDLRQSVMVSGEEAVASGSVMAIKGMKSGQSQTLLKSGSFSRSKGHSDGNKCTHCGSTKHTRDTCFKLHGYPDWWHELQARKKRDAPAPEDIPGRATVAMADFQLSLIPVTELSTSIPDQGNCSQVLCSSTTRNDGAWIIDSGATDHMTFDPNDFSNTTQPRRTCIANANGATYPVTGAGTVPLSPSLSLAHTLLVPSLSNKLMSLKTKDEVSTVFQAFHAMVQTQFSSKIQILRSDNGGEYINQRLQAYFQQHGLLHETSCSQTPQQNGVAERKNRHILETARALLLGAMVPSCHWGDAVATAVYLINRMPSKILHFKTPLHILSTHVSLPSILMLPPRTFGCVAFVHLHKNQRTKLDPCAVRCLFLGYGLHKKGFWCYDPTTNRTYITMDVTFLESENFYPSPGEPHEVSPETEHAELRNEEPGNEAAETEHADLRNEEPGNEGAENQEPESPQSPYSSVPEDPLPPENVPEVSTPTAPLHANVLDSSTSYVLPVRHNRGKPPNRYSPDEEERKSKYPIANYVSTQGLSKPFKTFTQTLSSYHIPSSVEEALSDPEWAQAMQEELEALKKNNTWKLVPLPEGKKIVGCKWVFSIKYKADGSIDRYKARLVAKGFTQTYGIDYLETFSPVAKVLLSLAANLDWPLHQLDVKNAFLHGDLDEEVYMDIPPGYTGSAENQNSMRKYGYRQSNFDHTLFLKHRQSKVTALIVYVDDMIITGDDAEEISRLQEQLSTEFEMKNLGGLKYFLGIEVARSERGIFLSQRKYVLDLLTEVGLLECKPVDTPIVQNHRLGEYSDQVPADKVRYQRLVGKLIYLSHTRPDIAYAVSVVSQFMHNPSEDHMGAVIRILRYLKSSPGTGLMFSKNDHLNIEGYTDADWAGNILDRKSTSGYFTFVGGNLVTWRSKKQKVVALSSAEAEFRGMAKGLCELLWLRSLLTEVGFPPSSAMNLFCDNKAAIDISHNPIQHDRTKHVEVDRHFIKQNLEEKIIQFPFVKSEDQLADILTKAVSSRNFYDSLDKLGVRNIYTPT